MKPMLRIAVRRFDAFEQAIVAQFEDFLRASGRDALLECEALDLNPLHQALIGQRGLAEGVFDVAFLCTDWLAEAHAGGLLEDLEPHRARAPLPGWPSDWSPSLTGLPRFAGGLWGLPYHDGPECLIYRKDLLSAAGLEVPRTWDAFHEAARRLHAPAEGRHGTVLALFPDGHNGFYDFCIQVWSRGGEVTDARARPTLHTPAAEAALDWLRALAADAGAIAPGARQTDSIASGLMFARGEVALMANWFGFAAYADTAAESRVRGLVDVAPLPAGPGGQPVSLNVFWVLGIGSGSRHKGLAWDFLRHCASAPMDLLTTHKGAIGVRRSTWADAGVNARIPYYHRLDWLHEHARCLPLVPRLPALSRVVDELLGKALATREPSARLLAEAQQRALELA